MRKLLQYAIHITFIKCKIKNIMMRKALVCGMMGVAVSVITRVPKTQKITPTGNIFRKWDRYIWKFDTPAILISS